MNTSPEAASILSRLEVATHHLAASFGSSTTSRTAAAALSSLFPGLEHFTIGVKSFNQDWIVSSRSSIAHDGAHVSLHSDTGSCLGLVARQGVPLLASLAGAGARVLRGMTDIEQAVTDAPQCTHVACIPISGSGARGALLLSFSRAPNLSAKRLAGAGVLCSLLSTALGRTAPGVICSVETMVGIHTGCPCCDSDSDGELEMVEEEDCDEEEPGADGDPPPPASEPLLRPAVAAAAIVAHMEEEEISQCAGFPQELHLKGGKQGAKDFSGSAAAASSAATPAHFVDEPLLKASAAGGCFQFSKPALAAASEEGLQEKHPVLQSYADPTLEREYGRWSQERLKPVDFLFMALTVASTALMCVFPPEAQRGGDPKTRAACPVTAALLLVLLAALSIGRQWRDAAVAMSRLGMVASAVFLAGCGVEVAGLAAALGLGLQLRLSRHLPLQLAVLAVQLAPIATGQNVGGWRFFSGAAIFLLGFVAPTAMLWDTESRARAAFSAQLSSAAGLVPSQG